MPKPKTQHDRLLIRDQRTVLARRVKAVAALLRDGLREVGVTLTAPLDLEVIALARLQVHLELMEAKSARGEVISDDQLCRLSNALRHGLTKLGLRKAVLVPPRPAPRLTEIIKQQAGGSP